MTDRITKMMMLVLMAACLTLTGCFSIFSGGTSGRVVDVEDTSSPKKGIANVDVYVYTSEWEMNNDYKSWSKGSRFSPRSEKYAHTVTSSDGSFTISKVMWTSILPTYWRDGDTTTAYLLFYHEDYGLVKGDKAMLLSDTISDSVYQELRATRQKTALDLRIIDVATNRPTDKTLNVTVSVDQGNTYTATITGRGTVDISYPRDTSPDIKVTFTESAQKVSFKMCKDGTDDDWSFSEDEQVITGISGDRYSAEVYGKKCIVNPVFSGKTTGDGLKVTLKYNDEEIDTTYTNYRILGDTVEHGHYSGLGSGYEWDTGTYSGKTVSRDFSINENTVKVSSGQPDVVFNF